MRVILGGGGTGGHVYPALAVLEALRRPPYSLGPDDVLYAGSANRAEAQLAPRAGVAFEALTTGAVVERGPLRLIGSAFRNVAGVWQACGVIRRFRPDVVFVTGGYVSVPLVLAAALCHVPSVVCLPDAKPGLAVRFLARFARRVTVSALPVAAAFAPGKAAVTGYPVRAEFAAVDRPAARQRLGLTPDDRLLLVMGGSLGARGINRAIGQHLATLLPLCRVLHVSGPDDAAWLEEMRESLPEDLRGRYAVHAYLHHGVAETMAAADLGVFRAGASVLGELPAAGLPAVLVPYPHAGAHQRYNAGLLVAENAAVLLDEADIERLPAVVTGLLCDLPRLQAMRARLASLAKPQAAAAIAALLADLAAPTAHAGLAPTGR